MFIFSLLILGFSSLVAQIVMAREMIVSFWGNEFFIGWVLFAWLFWVGAGSVLVKFFTKPLGGQRLLFICHLLVALLVPLTIWLIRISKSLFIAAAGQVPDLLPTIATSFIAMAPLCLVFGIQFCAACEYGKERQDGQSHAGFLGQAYFYEALGFVLGGLAFSYGLVFLNEFETGAILIYLNVAAIFVWLLLEKPAYKRYFAVASMVTAGLGVVCFVFSQQLNVRSAALRFPNEQLVETRNSVFGNLAVTRTGDQYNFYESGMPVGTDRDEAFNESLVHFPMLSDTAPQKVLLIGSGFSGALREILKYNPQKIYYAECDPAMIGLARKYIPEFRGILKDSRVVVIKEDPRRSLKKLTPNLDVIIINLPNPSTGLVNRYFTDEFFGQVRRHLKPDGVVATHLKFSADSIPEPLGHLGASLYKTIQHQFNSVVILPEETLFMLASGSPLTNDPQVLVRRLQARGIRSYFLPSPAIVYRYTTDRIGKTKDVFVSDKRARINADMYPQGYLYNLIYWFSIFHQGLASMLAFVIQIKFIFVLILAIGLILAVSRAGKPSSRTKSLLIAAMATGGFSLMSAELTIIYGFQVFYGNLYYKIAWIIAAFMAATAAGTFWGNKNQETDFTKLVRCHAGIGVYFLVWYFLMWFSGQSGHLPLQEIWIILGAGIGVLVGWEFTYVNKLLFSGQNPQDSGQLGTIYAADLFGSCLGALAVSVFLIPVYGVYKTLLFLIIINILLAAVLFIHRKQE